MLRWLLGCALALTFLTACQEGSPRQATEVASPTTASRSATSATPAPTASPSPSPTAATTDFEVVLAAVGDVMLGRGPGEDIRRYGPFYPFQLVADALRQADIAFANLEAPITEGGVPANKDYVFRAPASAAESLAAAGIDVVSLANNHALDYGPEGLSDTMAVLQDSGIVYVGAGPVETAARRPAIVTVKGLRLAFLSYVNTPDDSVSGFSVASTAATADRAGVAWATPEAVAQDVAQAARQADIVIVSLHTGFEYREAPNALQLQLAHAAIDAGASLVLGHHPHVLQGIEEYKGGLIAYSLGNFVFDLDAADYAQPGLPSSLSLILRVRLGPAGVGGYDLLPVLIGEADGRPRLVSGQEAKPVEERMARLSAALAGS